MTDIANTEKVPVMVSVLCTAYNHEKYIRQCLDGFVFQKTDFRYEVLINDDASTDATASIIKEYETQYPSIIKPVYQSENLYSKHIPITGNILFPMAQGKYIALCEGDDWWSDSSKLQKQVEAMEKHPECGMCVHPVKRCSESGEFIGVFKPVIFPANEILSSEDFVGRIMEYDFFQTSSHFMRADIYRDYINNPPLFKKKCPVGDIPTQLYFAYKGPTYYIDEALSCYRTNSAGSWTERTLNQDTAKKLEHYQKMQNTFECFDEETGRIFHRSCLEGVWLRQRAIALLSGKAKDAKKLIFGENYCVFHECSFRDKASILAAAYCPHLLSAFRKIRERLFQ